MQVESERGQRIGSASPEHRLRPGAHLSQVICFAAAPGVGKVREIADRYAVRRRATNEAVAVPAQRRKPGVCAVHLLDANAEAPMRRGP